jgi:hypothetical protein
MNIFPEFPVSYKKYLALTYYSIKLSTSQGNLSRAFLMGSTLPTSERVLLKANNLQNKEEQQQ